MTEALRYETDRDGGELRVRLFGDLDMNGTLRLEQELDRALEQVPQRLVIDLERASFIDSSGVNLLIAVEQDASARGIDVRLVPGPREVMRVFETSGLVDALPFRRAG